MDGGARLGLRWQRRAVDRYAEAQLKEIEITPDEIAAADEAGYRARDKALELGWNSTMGDGDRDALFWRRGFYAEIAGAKYFGVPWLGAEFETHKLGDLAYGIQIRSRPHRNAKLTIRPRDDDSKPYVHILGHNHPWYLLVGWIWGWEGKRTEYAAVPKNGKEDEQLKKWPMFLVPERALRDVDELFEVCF